MILGTLIDRKKGIGVFILLLALGLSTEGFAAVQKPEMVAEAPGIKPELEKSLLFTEVITTDALEMTGIFGKKLTMRIPEEQEIQKIPRVPGEVERVPSDDMGMLPPTSMLGPRRQAVPRSQAAVPTTSSDELR